MSVSINNQRKTTLINYISKTTFNVLSHFQQVSTRIEDHFGSCLLYFCTLVNPNKSVHPITLQKYELSIIAPIPIVDPLLKTIRIFGG